MDPQTYAIQFSETSVPAEVADELQQLRARIVELEAENATLKALRKSSWHRRRHIPIGDEGHKV